jgi:hypothetical protein
VRQIVGVDCAAQLVNVGVAVARLGADGCAVDAVATRLDDPVAWIAERVDWQVPVLIALDAPLGWPAEMSRQLASHAPGDPLAGEGNALFRRRTDREVRARTGKVPLDVGADRIARAALGALQLLARLRSGSGADLPLLWSPPTTNESGVVEVYPAATLRQWGWPDRGYKSSAEPDQRARRTILTHLSDTLTFGDEVAGVAQASADALDALVCIRAALDVLEGRCPPPPDDPVVRSTEGWMWVRR